MKRKEELSMLHDHDALQSPVFDGKAARRGYALNAMCFSFNTAANRERFKADPEAYFDAYGLDEEQRDAVRRQYITAMIRVGGSPYYLLKLANLIGMDVQDVGAQQTGLTRAEFQARLQSMVA
jgi:protocatechuate 4,5-dioxygenase alpha chain